MCLRLPAVFSGTDSTKQVLVYLALLGYYAAGINLILTCPAFQEQCIDKRSFDCRVMNGVGLDVALLRQSTECTHWVCVVAGGWSRHCSERSTQGCSSFRALGLHIHVQYAQGIFSSILKRPF